MIMLIIIKQVINRLTEFNLTLNFEKSMFGFQELICLGHQITGEGIYPDSSKLEALERWSFPSSGKEMRSFLGFVNYMRKFIPKMSELSAPLQILTKTTKHLSPSTEEINSFDLIKKYLLKSPMLSHPDFSRPFYVATDASNIGIGAVLFQDNDDAIYNFKSSSRKYIGLYSKSLDSSQKNYSAHKKELLAIVKAINHFRYYLFGNKFTIITDHNSLKYMLTQKDLNTTISSWSEFIFSFNFAVVHCPGKNNFLPDFLSRIPTKTSTQAEPSTSISSTFIIETTEKQLDNSEFTTENQVETQTVNEFEVSLSSKEELICAKFSKNFVAPSVRENLLSTEHTLSHSSGESLYSKLWEKGFYWEFMQTDCHRFVMSCSACQQITIGKKGFKPQSSILSSSPMDHIALDLAGPFPEENGFKYILLVVDIFSKYVWLTPLVDKSAKQVASSLLQIFTAFGIPKIVSSDNGKEFVNELLEHLSIIFTFNHRKSTPYYPQGNGISERSIRTMLDLLKKRCIDLDHKNWPHLLPSVQIGMNARVHTLSNTTPFAAMFSRELNDLKSYRNEQILIPSADEIYQRINFARNILFPELEKKMKKNSNKNNKNFDASHLSSSIQKGDAVMVKIPILQSKLKPVYAGPFKVTHETRAGTFKLAGADNNTLPRGFASSQLKKVYSNELTENQYIEFISDHRVDEFGKMKYKVRWLGYGPADDTWEPESNFDDISIVENYLASIQPQSPILVGNDVIKNNQ